MNAAIRDSDAKSGEESIPVLVPYGCVHIDRDNVSHVGLYVPEEDASLWFQNHVPIIAIACWVWSTEVEFELVTGEEDGQRFLLDLTTCRQQWWSLEAVQE